MESVSGATPLRIARRGAPGTELVTSANPSRMACIECVLGFQSGLRWIGRWLVLNSGSVDLYPEQDIWLLTQILTVVEKGISFELISSEIEKSVCSQR